jgi:hypothetical protein
MFQIDLMSLSRLYYFFGYETPKRIRKPKGPWVLVTIDLYSRYIDLQYIGNTATIENIIKHLEITFHKIGKPKILEADHQFNTKLFRILTLEFRDTFRPWLDIVSDEFNNHYHKGIKTTPIVLRKPQPPRAGSVIYGRPLDIDSEPFQVMARIGNNVGLYQIQSLISGKIERK